MAESAAGKKEKENAYVTVRGLTLGTGRPKICVPLTGRNKAEIFAELVKMGTGKFDLIEWRADKFEALFQASAVLEIAEMIREVFPEKPLIFTVRTNKDMESFEISDEEYKNINLFAAENKVADLIDLEYSRGAAFVRELADAVRAHGLKVICSRHLKDHTPPAAEIFGTMTAMEETGADLVKYAAMPVCERDVLELMDATLRMKERNGRAPFITMSMGGLGVISRISGSLTGSCLSFGTVGAASAPGQLPCSTLNEILEIL